MTPEERWELFRGFPLLKRDRDALDSISRSARTKRGAPLPFRQNRANASVLFNLLGRGWVIRTERTQDFAEETYAITAEGERALEMDDAALALGLKRPRAHMTAISTHENLQARLAALRNSK